MPGGVPGSPRRALFLREQRKWAYSHLRVSGGNGRCGPLACRVDRNVGRPVSATILVAAPDSTVTGV